MHDDTHTESTDSEPTTPGENSINDGAGMEIADPNDFFHRRDEQNELQPVLQKVPGRDEAMRVLPPTTGDYNKFHLEEEDPLYDDDALFAEFVNKFFPDLDRHVTEEDVKNNLIAFGAEPMVDMVKRAGGEDMKEALNERQTRRLMEMVGGDGELDFQKLVEMGQEMDEEEQD